MSNVTNDSALENKLFRNLRSAHAENSISWPYLDTRGYLTIGVGHNFQSGDRSMDTIKPDFIKLPWLVNVSGTGRLRKATSEEIEDGFNELKDFFSQRRSQNFNFRASHYKSITPLILPPEEIDRLLLNDIREKIATTRRVIDNFDKLTQGQRYVAVDLAFNGALKKFDKAAETGNIQAMAKALFDVTAGINNDNKIMRNWQRLIENHMQVTGATRAETITAIARHFLNDYKKQANIPAEIMREIERLLKQAQPPCQSPVDVRTHQRAGLKIHAYERSCPSTGRR